MELTSHLDRFAEKYHEIVVHPSFLIQDRYVFTLNSLLSELNSIAMRHNTKIEIINVEIDMNNAHIPTLILVSNKTNNYISRELDTFFDLCELEFTAAFIRSYFN
jgi:hypothetical protein